MLRSICTSNTINYHNYALDDDDDNDDANTRQNFFTY